jgi:hypothetical protein
MALGKIKAVTVAGLAALTLGGGMLAAAAPAEARPWGYRGGFQRGAFHGGPGFYRPYYRPAFYGGYYRRPYYRPYGGAVAAGLVGGLALGALAASSTYATPYYASPYYVASPGYDYGPACTITKTRFVDGWGRVVIRKTKVCD